MLKCTIKDTASINFYNNHFSCKIKITTYYLMLLTKKKPALV